MDLSLRIKQKLERNDNNPSSPTGQDVRTENFSEQFRQVRELQVSGENSECLSQMIIYICVDFRIAPQSSGSQS